MALTPEQLKRIRESYGITPENSPEASMSKDFDDAWGPAPEDEGPGYFERLGGQYMEGAEDIIETVKRPGEKLFDKSKPLHERVADASRALVETPLRTVGTVAEKAFAPITEAIAPAIKPYIDKIAEIPGVKENMENIVSWANDNPEAAKNIESLLNIFGLGAGKTAEEVVKPVLKKGSEVIVDTTKAGKDAIVNLPKKAGRVIENIAAKDTPKQIQSVLKETRADVFDEYVTVAKKASENFKNPTPLEVAGKKAQDALGIIQEKLATIGNLKRGAIQTFGDKKVGTIATQFRQDLEGFVKGKGFVEGDTKLVQDLIAKSRQLGNNPSAADVDNFIDYAQEALYTSSRNLTVPITDSTTAGIRNFLGKLNENLKNELPESYRTLNKKYSDIVGVRNELNIKLGKEGERGGALMKRVFSPSDANTKNLFEEVKNLTGVDLVNEATLARFVMEAIGDARQASLLEQLQIPNLSKSGVLGYFIDAAKSRFNTPEAIFRRAREMTTQ